MQLAYCIIFYGSDTREILFPLFSEFKLNNNNFAPWCLDRWTLKPKDRQTLGYKCHQMATIDAIVTVIATTKTKPTGDIKNFKLFYPSSFQESENKWKYQQIPLFRAILAILPPPIHLYLNLYYFFFKSVTVMLYLLIHSFFYLLVVPTHWYVLVLTSRLCRAREHYLTELGFLWI